MVCVLARDYLRYSYHVCTGVVACTVESGGPVVLEVLSRGAYTCTNLQIALASCVLFSSKVVLSSDILVCSSFPIR